ASETWSHTLSGWPSVTDSEVSRYELEVVNEVMGDAGVVYPAGRRRLSARHLLLVLAQEPPLQREDVVEDTVDPASLEPVVRDQSAGAEEVTQPVGQGSVHPDPAVGEGVLQELQALVERPHPGPVDTAPGSHHVPKTSTRPSVRTLTFTNGRAGRG